MYDKYLSDKSKLLWGLVSAASNEYGLCEDDNKYFAAALNSDPRTILRCLAQLIENGHLVRLYEKNKRKLKVVFRSLPIPENKDLVVDKQVDADSEIDFATKVIAHWEDRLKFTLEDKEATVRVIRTRLKSFSQEEIIKAVDNRIEMLRSSQWHTENKDTAYDIYLLISSDETVLKWLQINSK